MAKSPFMVRSSPATHLLPPAHPNRCTVYAGYPDMPNVCCYCDRREADHDEYALNGPHVDPALEPGAAIADDLAARWSPAR